MAPPPPAALVDDVIEEVLLRVPPDDPGELFRAALVCKAWRRVACYPGFHRRFREVHHQPAPPVLGVICNLAGDPGTARFVPTSRFRSPRADRRGWRALDARHGRVLLADLAWEHGHVEEPLVVWDPVAAQRLVLPAPPRHLEAALPWSNWNAAFLCAAAAGGGDGGACDHLDCRRGPYLVVLVATGLDCVFAHVYSSEAGVWSQPTEPFQLQGVSLDYYACSALAGHVLFFQLQMGAGILKYDLAAWEMSVIQLPLRGDYGRRIVLMTSEDGGGLGFAVMHGSRLHLWSRAGHDQGAGWAQSRVIELQTLLPADALSTTPYAVGIANGVGVFFVRTFDGWLFSIDLKSGRVMKVHKANGIGGVLPYVSFCTPGL